MIVMVGVGIPHRLELAQAARPAQLAADQADQMAPAVEALVVGVALATIHNRAELTPINRLEQAAQNATPVQHARSFAFLSLDNQKVTDWCRQDRACTCGTVNHSPDSPAREWNAERLGCGMWNAYAGAEPWVAV